MNPDFRDMLIALSDAGAEYLLVGAYALAAHGHPRATGDIDLWVGTDRENARRVWAALVEFGAPLQGIQEDDFATPDLVYQIGLPPHRIDLLTEIEGVRFAEAWEARTETLLEGLTIPVISRRHLLDNKRATGRKQDEVDVARLEEQRRG